VVYHPVIRLENERMTPRPDQGGELKDGKTDSDETSNLKSIFKGFV
jgi:hypothetical protein